MQSFMLAEAVNGHGPIGGRSDDNFRIDCAEGCDPIYSPLFTADVSFFDWAGTASSINGKETTDA